MVLLPSAAATAWTIFWAASAMPSAATMLRPLSARISLPLLDVGPFETDDERHLEGDLFGGFDDAGGDDVALHDAAEDVDEDPFDVACRRG